ncbi:MAG TPA: Gmad2 immunoglobulin-like domain-containing protein [Thermoanaerobaculia bacterium]
MPSPAPSATTPPSTPSSPPARPAPVERNIYLDGVEVANPVVVTGRARTFENNVALRLRDARGALIVESFTTSTGEIGHHNPYRGTLWVTRDPRGEITVEALEYSAKDGSETALVSVTRPFAVESIDATLYFPDTSCTGVKPYVRRMPKSVSHARLLLEALIAGPLSSERGAAAPFPSGSRVESVNLRDGVLTVDFNERLQNVGGACQAQMIRAAVTRTLQALPSVKKVVITAGGSESLALQP